jgi:DNA polymerase-3 subunit epsilon
VRGGRIERKIVLAILAMISIPTALVEIAFLTLYVRGGLDDPRALLLAVLVGLPAGMACLGWVAHSAARSVIHSVEALQRGTELMATVSPEHRLELYTGDELEAIAGSVNRLADHLHEARQAGEAALAAATSGLRSRLDFVSAVVEELAEGVVVAARDGRITLANRAARDLLAGGAVLVGRNLLEFLADERLRGVLGGPPTGVVTRFAVQRAGGERLWLAATALAGPGTRWAGVVLAVHGSRPAEDGAAAPARAAPAPGGFVGAGLRSGVAADVPGPERAESYDVALFEAAGHRAGASDADRRLDEIEIVVFDTETTGLQPEAGDRIVSLAGVRVRAGDVRPGEVFDALVRPPRPIPAASTRFHGITDDMVASAPTIDVVLPAFLRFAGTAVLVGHELAFDLAFLDREARRLGLPVLAATHLVLDTRALSRLVHGRNADHSIEAVARRLGVAVTGRHSALGDALTTAEVLTRLLTLLGGRGVRTVGQMLALLKGASPSR